MAKSNGDAPHSYSRFTKKDIEKLGLKIRTKSLFPALQPIAPSAWLRESLDKAPKTRLATEKAKSEFLISPILLELESRNATKIGLFSGYIFDIDAEKGLSGFCDYVFSAEANSPDIEAPVFFVVEAKNENLEFGTPQCIAAMYAARMFNEQHDKTGRPVFGAVTFGKEWRFFQLQDDIVWREPNDFQLADLPSILGALEAIVQQV